MSELEIYKHRGDLIAPTTGFYFIKPMYSDKRCHTTTKVPRKTLFPTFPITYFFITCSTQPKKKKKGSLAPSCIKYQNFYQRSFHHYCVTWNIHWEVPKKNKKKLKVSSLNSNPDSQTVTSERLFTRKQWSSLTTPFSPC